jgi:hypothetical protein
LEAIILRKIRPPDEQEALREQNKLPYLLWQITQIFKSMLEKEYGFRSNKEHRYI